MRSPTPSFALRRTAVAVLLAATVLGCASSGVNRGQLNLISLQEEWQLGQQLEADLARRLQLVDDPASLAYVNEVGRAIVRRTEMAELPWEFHLVANPEVNAFNIPGGHVYVNTGLIAQADDAAEFAGVLAHEISHGVSRHGTEQLSRSYGIGILGSILLGQNPQAYEEILAQILAQGSLARFSRAAEGEADRLGIQYMYDAGFEPRGLVEIFQRLLASRRSRPSSVERFFSTHPLTEERLAEAERQIAALPRRSGLVQRDPDYDRLQERVARYGR
jgi:beta-barrel assembly-enhancing protease